MRLLNNTSIEYRQRGSYIVAWSSKSTNLPKGYHHPQIDAALNHTISNSSLLINTSPSKNHSGVETLMAIGTLNATLFSL